MAATRSVASRRPTRPIVSNISHISKMRLNSACTSVIPRVRTRSILI